MEEEEEDEEDEEDEEHEEDEEDEDKEDSRHWRRARQRHADQMQWWRSTAWKSNRRVERRTAWIMLTTHLHGEVCPLQLPASKKLRMHVCLLLAIPPQCLPSPAGLV